MPDPDNIRPLLASLFRSLCEFHQEMKDKIENPSLLEREDIKELAAKAYDANLRICCIKPFNDGSNRVARLVENLLRLNWGLRFKVITAQEKDRYLRDIQSHQDLYYRDS
jgi:fido (protein-threonine AMPylation protein)